MLARRKGLRRNICPPVIPISLNRTSAWSRLRLWREWPGFRLPLRIGQGTKLGSHAAGNRRRLTARLEAGEVGPVAPGDGAAETNAGLDGRVVHDVDGTLVVRRSLSEPREIREIATGGK